MFSYEKKKWNETRFFHDCTALVILVLCNSATNCQNIFIWKNCLHKLFIRETNMEKVARGKRASENQKEYLINYLEENVDIANDK